MLVLTRKASQKIITTIDLSKVPPGTKEIQIDITLVSQKGDASRIGLEAPDYVKFLRPEAHSEEPHESKQSRSGG